jgi:hypothetical protein
MGMHHGILAATGSLDDLVRALTVETGDLMVSGEPKKIADIDFSDRADGWVLAAGEMSGNAYIFDTSFLLSDPPDMIVRLSRHLGLVAGCGAETVSGSYYLTIARDGELRRFLWIQHAGMTKGMAVGEPLACEEREDFQFDALDGSGLDKAMVEIGLDPWGWLRDGLAQPLFYTCARRPEDGPVTKLRMQHYEQYQRPEDEWLSELTVVAREPKD